jgi:hypothetical protein
MAQWYSTGLRARWSGVRVPPGTENFSLHHRVQTGSGAHPASFPMGNRDYLFENKAAEAWISPFTSLQCRGQECVELYVHASNTPSWRGAQLKHRDDCNFTFMFGSIRPLLIVQFLRILGTATFLEEGKSSGPQSLRHSPHSATE